MQNELNTMNLNASILGVNHMDKSSANQQMTEGRDIPWIQDVPTVNAWTTWDISYRDVIILNADNEYEATINVTTSNLTEADGYNSLMDLITEALSN